jgi:hypothetical protein
VPGIWCGLGNLVQIQVGSSLFCSLFSKIAQNRVHLAHANG